jgi:hypothetical protein
LTNNFFCKGINAYFIFFLFSYYIKNMQGEFGFDVKEILVRIFKYLFEGLVVAVAAYLIPGKKLQAVEILTIGLVSASTFAVIDLLLPSYSQALRTGSAFAMGSNLVGGLNAPIRV